MGGRAGLGGLDRLDRIIEPHLLDRENMAAAICVSASVIDELNLAGCPTVPVPTNDAILYDPVEVVNWMKSKRNEVDPEDFELTPLGKQLSTPESAESEA